MPIGHDERQGPVDFLIASLMASTLTEPTSEVGFSRGCEGAIVDGTDGKASLRVNPVAETPGRTVTRAQPSRWCTHKFGST